MACGSGAAGPKPVPLETTLPIQVQPPDPPAVDAAIPDAEPPPKLACEPGTTLTAAAFPKSALYCERTDGVRHGAFATLFPDGAVETTGTYKDGKLDGPWHRNYPDGSIAEQGDYVDGVKDGTWRQVRADGTMLGEYQLSHGTGVEQTWNDDGTLFMERTLKSGADAGAFRVFDRAGALVISASRLGARYEGAHVVGNKATLRLEETYSRGKLVGPRRLWSFGTVILEENYDHNGQLDGRFASWRDRKSPRVQGSYSHGKRVGKWTWFDRTRSKEREGNFVAGKKTGTWSEWLEGKLVSRGNYSDDKPDGEFVYYDTTGVVLGRFAFKDGTGEMMTFYPNRQVASRQHMVNGLRHGSYQEFALTGRMVVSGKYVRDHKHGSWREWTDLGALTLEQHWKRGTLDGVVKKYDGGKLHSEAHYKNGRAVGGYTEYRNGKPALTGQFVEDRRQGTWTSYDAEGNVTLIATYKGGVLDGPWKQLAGGAVLEGDMVAGRRSGTWTRTDLGGVTSTTTYSVGSDVR